ncbi:helix-turn-helix domain-containing protein [Psychroflexus planctonicus]|uniref:Helix-turn-helix domain-containing protein n=1 Tax=Psychroflexus planctonicus TaxID=1526575 RepID=A0ABQ1SML9_9FLAO|nr:helix-turn-helix domain-containing protein [Psychroflexus planctonicus]GGE42151.1 hypothetical protein GCM10010832_22650 [Psychroflexus planctonicus]
MNIEIQIPESLTNDIKALRSELAELKTNLQPKASSTKYLTRHEVAKMLNITIGTLHNYTTRGILTAYQIGGRVLYKANDIENAIVELKK